MRTSTIHYTHFNPIYKVHCIRCTVAVLQAALSCVPSCTMNNAQCKNALNMLAFSSIFAEVHMFESMRTPDCVGNAFA